MDDEFFHDEFYPECPECGEEVMDMGDGHAYCPGCGWHGSIWEAN